MNLQNDTQPNLLQISREVKSPKFTAASLIRYRWFVTEDSNLLDVADAILDKPDIPALGVVDKDNHALGTLYRRDLLDLLGRPFGRDVMKKESVSRALRKAPVFYGDTSIYTIYETLESLKSEEHHPFFPIQSQGGEYLGILSSQDLLTYLSQKTATDLTMARSIRNTMIRNSYSTRVEGIEGAEASIHSQDLGGDFHFCRSLDDTTLVLGLIELPNEGMPSVIATSALYGALSAHDTTKGIGRIVRVMHRVLSRVFRGNHDVPGIFFEVNRETRRLLVGDMGQGQGFLYRNSSLLRLKSPQENRPLGSSGDFHPTLCAYELEPGDIYLGTSRRVFQQEGPLEQNYGFHEIKKVLEKHQNSSAVIIVNELIKSLHTFGKGSPGQLDGVFLVLKAS